MTPEIHLKKFTGLYF